MENNGKGIIPNMSFYSFNQPPKVSSSSLVDAIIRKQPIVTTICKSSVVITPSPAEDNRLSIQTDNGIKFTVECNMDSNIDGNKLKRNIANRIYSHNSRKKKQQQCHHLNMTVKKLKEEILVNKALVETKRQKLDELKLENSRLMVSLSLYNDQLEAAKVKHYRELTQMQVTPVIESSYNGDTTQTIPETNRDMDELETFFSSYNGDTNQTMPETKWDLDELEAFLFDD